MAPRTFLITGATGGIGRALAWRCARRGDRLALLGRRPLSELDADLYAPANYFAGDLRDERRLAALGDWLDERGVDRLDALVLNAGVGWLGAVADQPAASVEELTDVNLWAPMAMTHQLLDRVEPAGGVIAVVSSVVAALPCPDYAVYAAAKAALEGWARSLREELRGRVAVLTFRPGATRTAFHEKLGADARRFRVDRFADPERVAGDLLAAIDRRQTFAASGAGNRAVGWIGSHFPRLVDALVEWRRR